MKNLTKSTKPQKETHINRKWHLIDLKDQRLGRVATKISHILQGKHKVTYTGYLDSGDYVVAVNAKEIVVTGKKKKDKVYTRYSGYPGGLKEISFEKMINQKPTEVIRLAVSGMLPKNKLRDRRMTRLFIFSNEKHPYEEKLKS